MAVTSDLKSVTTTFTLITGTTSEGTPKYASTNLNGGTINPETWDKEKFMNIVKAIEPLYGYTMAYTYASEKSRLIG